jgi:hypothetical protein
MMHRIWSLPNAVRNAYDLSNLRSCFRRLRQCRHG